MSNSEKSDEHFILLDVHQIEKRQVVAPSTTHMSDSAHLTASSTTKMPSSNPPTSKLPNSTPSSTTHMSHSAHVSTTKVPGLTTSSTANHDSVSRQQTTHQPQTTGTSLPVETTTPISYIKVCYLLFTTVIESIAKIILKYLLIQCMYKLFSFRFRRRIVLHSFQLSLFLPHFYHS